MFAFLEDNHLKILYLPNPKENYFKIREAEKGDEHYPMIESVFKLKDGSPHPITEGPADIDFLTFNL